MYEPTPHFRTAAAAPEPVMPYALCGAGNPGDAMVAKRLAALDRYQILDSAPEPAFDDVVALAARVCGATAAAISLLDDNRQWFKATHGFDAAETPIAVSFCRHALDSEELLLVENATLDARFAANPFVTGEPGIRFYAGMPIQAEDGTPIGTLCVFDTVPRPDGLSDVELMTMRVLAAQVRSLLELRRSVLERQAQIVAQGRLTRKLRHVADHDALTGLPHRRPFQKRLVEALRQAEASGTRVVLMLVDVDHFKQVNDSLGHDVGDAMLRRFSARLRAAVRSTDTVARLGGDEFGVLLTGIEGEDQLAAIARSMNDRLHEPMRHRGRTVECRASIGLAIYPDHATTPQALTKCSDLALAEAKRLRGRIRTFCPSMTEEFQRETEMLSVAREGLASGQFLAHYQPKVDLRSGALVGFEALLRCRRGQDSFLLPEHFAHAFADRELALSISRRMIATVLDDMRGWVDRGLDFGHVAINTGMADYYADDFAESLLAEIERRDLDPSMIEVEVTEGVFLGRGAHHVGRALSMLSERGMRIALDDFGTGYASLTHLRQFRVDVLKIDRSFVGGLGTNIDDTAIVRALIGLGNSLGIVTVAEGIETQAQAEFVKARGCDIGQGYLFGAAHGPSHVPAIIGRYQARAAA
jgi:diguanylate cyclase (GGDEF)-like protein